MGISDSGEKNAEVVRMLPVTKLTF